MVRRLEALSSLSVWLSPICMGKVLLVTSERGSNDVVRRAGYQGVDLRSFRYP